MVAVGARHFAGRHEAVTLDLAERIAYRGGHGREAGLGARIGVHGVDLGDHARPLPCEVLTLGAEGGQAQTKRR